MRLLALPVLLASALAATAAEPPKQHHDHAADLAAYEGAKTCAECHEEAVKDFAVSLHYQQAAAAPNLDGWPEGKPAGMMRNY